MLVYVRPSNEALLRARVARAQDQLGCPSNPFHRARSASKEGTWLLPPLPLFPSTRRARDDELGGGSVLDCARPTRVVCDRALREQENIPIP